MKKLILLLLFPFVCYAQYPLQRNMSIPRGDARTIEFTTDNNLSGDSIVFTMSLYYQETYMNSTNNALRLGNWKAFGGSATQVLAYDSTGGKVRVYVTMANTLGLTERQFFYSLRVNDTSKYYGTITMVPTVFTTSWLTYLTNNDTTKFVSRTNMVVPGLATSDTANRVIKVDATGKFFLGWAVAGQTIDSTTLFSQRWKNNEDAHAGFADGDSVQTSLLANQNTIAGKAGADSVQTALKTLQNLIGGKGDSDSLSTAYAAAQAAFAKGDTAALHAQLFKIGENISAGKANADSIAQQIKLVKDLIAGRRDSTTINGVKDVSFTIVVPSDSMLINTVTRDSLGLFQSDTVRWGYMDVEYPYMMPRYNTLYGGTKLVGSVGIRFNLGGLMRAASSPYEFLIVSDSANGVEIKGIYLQCWTEEATAEDMRFQEINLSYDNTAGTAMTATARTLGNLNALMTFSPYPQGSGVRKQLKIVATAVATTASAAYCRMIVFYRQAAGNNYSTWFIKLASF